MKVDRENALCLTILSRNDVYDSYRKSYFDAIAAAPFIE